MNYSVFSENGWLYPDSEIGNVREARLDAARGGTAGFQVLTDKVLSGGESLKCSCPVGDLQVEFYRLLPVNVPLNTGKDLYTAREYSEVEGLVTRKAPFEVYDVTRPVGCGEPEEAGRLALYVKLSVPASVEPGERRMEMTLSAGGDAIRIPVAVNVHRAVVPKAGEGAFGMVNWFHPPRVEEAHGVEYGTAAWDDLMRAYIRCEIEMRNTHLMLESGVPIRDGQGRVVGFDFSKMIHLGKIAIDEGMRYVMGGFVAHWKEGGAPDTLYLLWDMDIPVTCHEGARQLKLYFDTLRGVVEQQGWQDRYYQCMVDEPQEASKMCYRALAAICRRSMPGIRIHDPVEASDLEGAVDVWVVKQTLFESRRAEYTPMIRDGEEFWLYTCAFPAGHTMNRLLDIPLTVNRLVMWMCRLFGCKGFLHWGLSCYTKDPYRDTCYHQPQDADGKMLPPGDAFCVYPGQDGPVMGLRAQLQRAGAEDFELLDQLYRVASEKAEAIISSVARTFVDYEEDAGKFDEARRRILTALD